MIINKFDWIVMPLKLELFNRIVSLDFSRFYLGVYNK